MMPFISAPKFEHCVGTKQSLQTGTIIQQENNVAQIYNCCSQLNRKACTEKVTGTKQRLTSS
jgi:hypothetical protein